MRAEREAGTLYVVATPIGNLGDVTLRALDVLRAVDRIACEDTRRTRKLLAHHGIRTALFAYHDHNEAREARAIVERLQEGETIALVTDSGTPLVSDPGYRVVTLAAEEGLDVVPVPGPSAVAAALSAAGVPPHPFLFAGFLPRKSGARRRRIEELGEVAATLVLYESPHRIAATLRDLAAVLGDRRAAVCRELTKVHEEFLRGGLAELAGLAERRPLKGEIVVVVAPRREKDGSASREGP
jgi:16S rRNA (cytidine1402-2'-O)-methyltransferase